MTLQGAVSARLARDAVAVFVVPPPISRTSFAGGSCSNGPRGLAARRRRQMSERQRRRSEGVRRFPEHEAGEGGKRSDRGWRQPVDYVSVEAPRSDMLHARRLRLAAFALEQRQRPGGFQQRHPEALFDRREPTLAAG